MGSFLVCGGSPGQSWADCTIGMSESGISDEDRMGSLSFHCVVNDICVEKWFSDNLESQSFIE